MTSSQTAENAWKDDDFKRLVQRYKVHGVQALNGGVGRIPLARMPVPAPNIPPNVLHANLPAPDPLAASSPRTPAAQKILPLKPRGQDSLALTRSFSLA